MPLSLFFVDLEPNSANKNIFNIEYLLNAKITFEPPLKKPDIVQCKGAKTMATLKLIAGTHFDV